MLLQGAIYPWIIYVTFVPRDWRKITGVDLEIISVKACSRYACMSHRCTMGQALQTRADVRQDRLCRQTCQMMSQSDCCSEFSSAGFVS